MHGKVLLVGLTAAFALSAAAQVASVSTIQTTGEGTVEVAPEIVVFWLHKDAPSGTFLEAFGAVLRLGPALRQELTERGLAPLDLNVSAPSVPLTGERNARVSASVTFSMNAFADAEKGPPAFAALCDHLLDVAAKLECLLEGPLFDVRDRAEVEQAAANIAIEQALPVAQSLAGLMGGHVSVVDRVTVEEAKWNADPDTKAALPDMRRMSCTIRVHVTYAFGGAAE